MRTRPRLLAWTALAAVGLALGASAAASGASAAPGAAEAGAPVKRYIVVLSEPPLAQYQGGIQGFAPTAVNAAAEPEARAGGDVHLDLGSPAARAYTDYLLRRQDGVMQAVRRVAPEFDERDWQYQYVLNGFVAQLTPRSVERVRALPGVRLVAPTAELLPEMDATKYLVGTMAAWEAIGGVAEAGSGARVATLEAGNAPMHPFFSDEGMPAPPAGFPMARAYARDGSTVDLAPAKLVNNKVVAFKPLLTTLTDTTINNLNNGSYLSQHGTHVAGTMTGRWGNYPLDVSGPKVDMAGIAPMAHLFTYPVLGSTAEMVKSFELMVEDEIDAVNLSLGTITWLIDTPEMDPVSLAMSGATDAGIVVVGSSGNAGSNGRTSMSAAWKYNEDVVAVGNTSTNGRLFTLIQLDSPGAPEELKRLEGGLRGNPAPAPVTGEAVYRDDGGCNASDTVSGKIAVVERFLADGTAVGTCSYAQRATVMAQSGAIGIVYVYYDRLVGDVSTDPLDLPAVALGSIDGTMLVEWMKAGHPTTLTLDNAVTRAYDGPADVLQGSSSRGPGLDWAIKPDITAPGSSIYSSMMEDPDSTDTDTTPTRAAFRAIGGTSMAAPHVTGAAALIRSAHPEWTARQVKSAMVTTVDPSVTVVSGESSRPADPTEGGPGRLDVAAALKPGAFLTPPKLSFGKLGPGESRTLSVTAGASETREITWDVSVVGGAGDATVTPSVTELTVAPGAPGTFEVTLATANGSADEHWGYVVLTERVPPPPLYLPALMKNGTLGEAAPGGVAGPGPRSVAPAAEEAAPRVLRLAYYAFVDLAAARKNVLLVDWTYGNTADYTRYYTETLQTLGLSYTVWGLGEAGEHPQGVARTSHPPYKTMMQHDLVLINGNMSPRSFHNNALPGMFQYNNLALGGGNLLIAGQGNLGWWRYLNRATRYADTPNNRNAFPDTWPFSWSGASQNVGCEMCIARYFAGFTPGYTATLSGKLLIPFPMPPAEPELDVTLAPHPQADGTFPYSLDISTGAKAKDGAAGNQFRFASGEVAKDFLPTTSAQITARLGDIDTADGVMGRYSQLAKPLWSYPVSDTLKVVGTYIAGKQQPAAKVPWNAMYWGFGLEGVGQGGEGTVGRQRLLGDAYNFLAKNIAPSAVMSLGPDGRAELAVSLGPRAAPVRFLGAEVRWGDGPVERRRYERPVTAEQLGLAHRFAAAAAAVAQVEVKLLPEPGTAAPVYVSAAAP